MKQKRCFTKLLRVRDSLQVSARSEDYSSGWRHAAGPGCGHVMNQTGYQGLEMPLIMCSPSIRVFGFSSVAKQTLGLGVDSHHSTTQEVEAEG